MGQVRPMPLLASIMLAALALVRLSSGAAALTAEEIANLTGPDRQAILEEGAKKEGELLWVGSFNEDNAKRILEGFAKKYPFIKVNRVRTDSTKALQRVLAELRARSPKTDLITSNAVVELREAGAVQAFRSPALETYPAEDKDPDGYSAPLYFVHYGLAAYNTDLVPEAEAPKTLNDLLDPKWRGQMVFNSGSSGAPFFIGFLRLHLGEEQALAYLEKLAKQKIVSRSESARTVLGMTISGEHKIMINPFITHVAEARRKRAPINVTMQDPVAVTSTPFQMAKNAPHPHATMLLIDYLLGPEAQGVLSEAGYFPSNPAVEPRADLQPFSPKARGFSKFVVDDTKLGEMMPQTMKIYSRLFE